MRFDDEDHDSVDVQQMQQQLSQYRHDITIAALLLALSVTALIGIAALIRFAFA